MKQDLRVSVTKQMIHKALLRLLENKSIDKIKVSELCAESGVNRATFYRHYETIQDILHEMEADLIQRMPHPDRPPRNIEEVRLTLESICTYMYDNADVLKVLFLNRTDEDMTRTLMSFYQEFLRHHQNELHFALLDEDTQQIIITLLGGGCHSLLKKWIMGTIQKSPKELADILCDILYFQGPFESALILSR